MKNKKKELQIFKKLFWKTSRLVGYMRATQFCTLRRKCEYGCVVPASGY